MWNILNVSKSVKTPICNWNQRSGCDDTLPRSDMLMTWISFDRCLIIILLLLSDDHWPKSDIKKTDWGVIAVLHIWSTLVLCVIINTVFQNRALGVFRDQIDISGGWVYKVMLICLKFCHLIKIVMHTLNYNGFWCTV